MNADDKLQWWSCICNNVIKVVVVESSLFIIRVIDVTDIFLTRYNVF